METVHEQRYIYQTMATASPEELEALVKNGILPEQEQLAGWEFKGFNRPEMTQYLGIRKFIKGFYRDPNENQHGFCGYNVQANQNGIEGSWEKKQKNGKSIIHGYYHVIPTSVSQTDCLYPNAWLLDYGRSAKNPKLDPSRLLRDYLVQVYPDNTDLLLGKAYLALGSYRLYVSYFLLERLGKAELG